MKVPSLTQIIALLLFASTIPLAAAGEESEIRTAIEKSLFLLETAALGASDHNRCFTCHNHGLPIVTFVEARSRGFEIDAKNLSGFVSHTAAHLGRGKKNYAEGKGQGGQVSTAGYALWAMEAAGTPPDEITDSVVAYLLQRDAATPYWNAASSRPPSEGSRNTSTYLALRALKFFGKDEHQPAIEERRSAATDWLTETEPKSTEEHVFRLLALDLADTEKSHRDSAATALLKLQQENGGWKQLPEMETDAYATGSALFALAKSGQLPTESAAYAKGLKFLLDTQNEDGSWHVVTRARPIQKYYESGFPHGKDQFISTAATAWAALALLYTIPEAD